MENDRETRLDDNERKQMSAVVRTWGGYVFVDERRTQSDEVTRGDDERVHKKEDVPEVSTSASNQGQRTIRQAVAFSKQLSRRNSIENMTPKTPISPKVQRHLQNVKWFGGHN